MHGGELGPHTKECEFLTPEEEAHKGVLEQGSYSIKSNFTDKMHHLAFE